MRYLNQIGYNKKKEIKQHVFVIFTCILSNLKVTWNFSKDGTFRQHSFVPLPLYHRFITMVRGLIERNKIILSASTVFVVEFKCNKTGDYPRVIFQRHPSKGSFTLRRQRQNQSIFCVIAVAVMNGFNTHSTTMPLPLPSPCEQSHLVAHNPFMTKKNLNYFSFGCRRRCSVNEP